MRQRLIKALATTALLMLCGAFAFAGGQAEEQAEGQGQAELSGDIKIAGSSTVYPISVAIAEEFQKMHADVNPTVQSTGTGGGFANFFIPGETVINDASRPIADSELQQARDNGIEPLEFQVGWDAVTVVVHPDNPVDNVTVDQLAAIWGPENPPANWSAVNSSWPDAEFELYGPTAASGTFDFFTEVVMGEEGASRDDYQKTEQDNTIVQAVSTTENAMGYFGLAYYVENQDRVKGLSVNDAEPSKENASTGNYPLSRPLFIYVAKDALARPEVRAFVEYYLEQVDTDFISEVGYAPVSSEMAEENMQKLQDAISDVQS
jgi:phosphate transport system substrate-binding protein